MTLYTITTRTHFSNMPEGVYVDSKHVFNDLGVAEKALERTQGHTLSRPIKFEESYFKKGVLSCKRVIRDFLKEEREERLED